MKINEKNYPYWFRKPSPITEHQLMLFEPTLQEVLNEHRISIDEMILWNQKGWLSFNPCQKESFNQTDLLEIDFIRNVLRAGLCHNYINEIFDQLPKPLAYDSKKVSYSFTFGWVESVEYDHYIEGNYEEILETYIDNWIDDVLLDKDGDKREELITLFEGIVLKLKENFLEE